MLSRADLIHDVADVLHRARMSKMVDGALPIETPSALPTRRDREHAEDIIDRLLELGALAIDSRAGDSEAPAMIRR
jgi:hypothetical protein